MKIKIIGKVHREGKSKKSGNDYNFNQVHFTGPDRGVDGTAALTLNLYPSVIPYAEIRIGGEYEADFDPAAMLSASRQLRLKLWPDSADIADTQEDYCFPARIGRHQLWTKSTKDSLTRIVLIML